MENNSLFILRLSSDEEMKLRIVHGVAPNIHEATIDSICENAGISRRTFYNYFSSKHDLSPWYKKFVSGHTVAQIGISCSWAEGFERLFMLLEEEREPIMRTATAHFQGNPTSFDSVVNSANWSKTRVEQLNTVLEQRGVDISERYLRYCIDLYPAIEGYAVRQWLAKPPVISPKEAAENLITCVPRPLYEALCDD